MIHEYVSKHLHTKSQQLHIAVTICLHPILKIEDHFLFYLSIIPLEKFNVIGGFKRIWFKVTGVRLHRPAEN